MLLDALLDDREVTILKAIIKTYLETEEPVGPRTTPKYSDPRLSSAAIRNEMSDLEEMGYIIQPHISTGRIPSDKGYRFYVDQIMLGKESEVTKFKKIMVQEVNELELVLEKMARVLAANINYVTMISGPSYHKTKFKFIQLSKTKEYKLLMAVVVESNIIKNTVIDIEDNFSDEELLNLNILLNNSLNGLTTEKINLDVISKLRGDAGNHSQVVDLVLNEMAEITKTGEEDSQIYTSGATNIFKYPELLDGNRASRLINILEHKEVLQKFVGEVNSRTEEEANIRVYIGDGSSMQSMEDYSVVIANYDLGGGLRGIIGVIGPKRVDYEKILGTLYSLTNRLDTTFKKDERR